MMAKKKITFGAFTIDTADETLRRGAEKIHLRPKTYALLLHLASQPGLLVTKDELMNRIWANCNIGEEALKHCVREIRKALNDNAAKPRFIETVHRRGYRFIGTPTTAERKNPKKQPKKFKAGEQNPPPGTSLFVGRENELAQLQQSLEKAMMGSRQVVFISGEQGIGKTLLVDAFLDIATSGKKADKRPHPWVTRGQCIRSRGTAEAYMPLMESLTELCHTSGGKSIIGTLCRYAPLWMSQMPSQLSTDQMLRIRISTRNATQERMLRELAEALEALTVDRLMILILEDLHHGDSSTLDWLQYWAQRRHPSQLMLIATCRPTETTANDSHFNTIRQELQARQLCRELPLLKRGHNT